ncbi:MAG: hypothetical protein ACP5U1_06085 [Desulfomonilaceae bacterium]
MIKTLVSIDVDLASSLAIRFVCQIGAYINMEIHPIYVKEIVSPDYSLEAGWASRTWEKEIIEHGKEEISKMVAAEADFCPKLYDPIVIYGDRQSEVSKVLQEGKFDLYVKGTDFPWNHSELYKMAHNKFYQHLQCPVIFVQSLRKIKKILLLCSNKDSIEILTRTFAKIWQGSSIPLVLVYPERQETTAGAIDLKNMILNAANTLEQADCKTESIQLEPKVFANPTEAKLETYGLVAVSLDRAVHRDSVELTWLSLVNTASLISFY